MHEIATVLLLSKSENHNQVHYAAAVDEACAPAGASPLRAYWRMLERGPDATVAGAAARLFNVHVALRLFGVDYVLLTGWRDDGALVRERLRP